AASEYVVGSAIDRFNSDELAGLVAKGRERSLRGIAPHHNTIITGGQTGDLQLVIPLVAPEPWLTVIGLGVSGKPRRNAARMVGGVLHRFKPERSPKARTCVQRAVADRRNVRIRRQQLLVHDNSRRYREAGCRRELDIGQHADPDHHEVGFDVPAVSQADAGYVDSIALDAGGLHAKMDPNARRGVAILKIIRNFPA